MHAQVMMFYVVLTLSKCVNGISFEALLFNNNKISSMGNI